MKTRISRCTTTMLLATALLLTTAAAQARTVEVSSEAFDQAAVLDARAPKLSWAGIRGRGNDYSTGAVELLPRKTLLLRYDLEGVVPEGMRITRALWVLPVGKQSPDQVRLEVWRMVSDWGPGVSHELRTAQPEREVWNQPGGRGAGTDRALSATGVATASNGEEITINVTRDVELWQTGAAQNYGWMVTVEDEGSLVTLPSPIGGGHENWKLRITYEPE